MNWNRISRSAQEIAGRWNTEGGPGGAILIFDQDFVHTEVYGGYADLATGRAFGPHTALRFASITKHLVAAAALVIHDHGAIDLDAPLSSILTGASQAIGSVPLARALDMTGGLPDILDTAWLLGVPRTALLDPVATLQFGKTLDRLNFTPGTELSYSNAGYSLFQAALEQQGTNLASFLLQQFFEPLSISLGMASNQSQPIKDLAPGYWLGPGGWTVGMFGMPYTGADALTGTPRALTTWLQALLANRGPAKGLLGKLTSPRFMDDGQVTQFGLALARLPIGDAELWGFGGQLPGYAAQFMLHPDTGTGVLVACNREDADASAFAQRLMAELLSVPVPQATTNQLPEGLFITEEGPYWLSHKPGQIAFMGARSPAAWDAVAQRVVGGPYLPLSLEACGGGIAGEVGFALRRFKPAPSDARADSAWAGAWADELRGASFDIEVYSGEATVIRGVGPTRTRSRLRPIGASRALFEHCEGPRTQHVCLEFDISRRSVRLVTNRSRTLEFLRKPA